MIIRVDQSHFNEDRWTNFIDAMNKLKQTNKYSELVGYHSNHNHHHQNVHVFPYFLSWHRKYIRIFEQSLIDADYNDVLPYWNWTNNFEGS